MVLLAVCLLLVIWVGCTQRPGVFSARSSDAIHSIRDISFTRIEDDSAPLGFYYEAAITIDREIDGQIDLVYHLVHEYTSVFEDGQLIYSLSAEEDALQKTIGNAWGVIPLFSRDIGKTLEIRIYPVYAGSSTLPEEFLLGERSAIISRELLRAAPSFLLSIIAIVTGLVYLIISKVGRLADYENTKALRWLGLFALLMGFWRITDTRVDTLVFPHASILISFVTLISLMLLPVPLILYLGFSRHLNSRYVSVICLCSIAVGAVVVCVQLAGFRDLRENLLLIHGVNLLGLIVEFIMIIRKRVLEGIRHKDASRSKSDPNTNAGYAAIQSMNRSGQDISLIMLCFIFAGISADLVEYYAFRNDRDMMWTLVCVDIYVIVTGIAFIQRIKREASVDVPTGIFNRNRCEELVNAPGPVPAGTMFIMCDLNRLKHVNDTLGHDAGDKMIALFAEALRETFSRESDFVGRYGGDEFIVILVGVNTREQAAEQLERLSGNVRRKQEQHPDIPISYSCGYSLSSEGNGENYYFMLRKADRYMYRNKKAWYDDNHLEARIS